MPTIGTDPLLADRIFDLLKREIISSRQKSGQPFNETVMAKRFKASRTPIREACGPRMESLRTNDSLGDEQSEQPWPKVTHPTFWRGGKWRSLEPPHGSLDGQAWELAEPSEN